MPREFLLPDIGEGLTEAEIVRWLVAEGDSVGADEPIVEVETDKAVVEIPSPFAGTVLRHGGAPGEVIEVGSVLVVIGDPAEEVQGIDDGAEQEAAEGVSSPSIESVLPTPSVSEQAAPIVGSLSEDAEMLTPRYQPAPQGSSPVKALPVVRKLARDHGIDLNDISGSGPDGRIGREDVEAAIEQKAATTSPTRAPTDEADREPAGEASAVSTKRMSRLRRTIAENMSKSWAEIPHVTTFDDVDATRLLETRTALSARHERKVPVEAFVVKAVLPALDAFPEFNSSLQGEELVIHDTQDIGIAVDTDDGLLVAVIRDAGARSLMELADEVTRLGESAKERKLSPDELSGQTFTVSNIGAVGGGHGTPIVPYGTTAILSVGRARERVIVEDGELLVAPVMPLSLSYDHRVIDGAVGRRFMSLVMENLAEPALFLAT